MVLYPLPVERSYWMQISGGRRCSAPPDRVYTIMTTAKTTTQLEHEMTYLTEKRINSLKQYLEDVTAGMDTVAAWKLHKARMAA